MRGLCVSLLLITACVAADDSKQILSSVQRNVATQISKTSNYACVETLDRAYYRDSGFELAMHGPAAIINPKNELLHDRLRLDVGVSNTQEIYSWHGSTFFSSAEVADVVRTGPISSGQFIGYLRNIFLTPEIGFTSDPSGDTDVYRFTYDVPPLHTRYALYANAGGYVRAPFRGSFTAHKSDFQLASLEVIPYDIPFNSSIQSAHTEVKYQLTRLSGRDALIPASFALQLEDESHIFTISRGEYSDCHEYAAESTLHFDLAEAPQAGPAPAPTVALEPALPPGLNLHVALSSGIDDETSYTGDSVKGVLLDPIRIGQDIIPRGAVLSGVLTQLETRFQPQEYCSVRIEFRQLMVGKHAYTMRALHQATTKDMHVLSALYGATAKASLDELRDGTMLIDSSHVHLRPGFKAEWRTQSIPRSGSRSAALR